MIVEGGKAESPRTWLQVLIYRCIGSQFTTQNRGVKFARTALGVNFRAVKFAGRAWVNDMGGVNTTGGGTYQLSAMF